MRTLDKLFLACLCLAAARPGPASPLFEGDGAIDVELIGPLHSVIGDTEARREFPFVLRSGGVDLDVDVRIRGKSRVVHCEFPPLRLNFNRSRATGTLFAGQDELKLVTHCRDKAANEANLLQEYLAYRIFGFLSEASFRVRLLRIRYSDTDGRSGPVERYGFLLEPLDEVAERLGGERLQVPGVTRGGLDAGQAALVYVFQYLIGNTDWSFVTASDEDECCHNGGLVGIGEDIFYIPYDFDMSGIVDASYAAPQPKLRLRSVRERRYRGFCAHQEAVPDALRQVRAQRDAILALVKNTPGLPAADAKQTTDYLLQFFDQAEDEKKLLNSFERRCIE